MVHAVGISVDNTHIAKEIVHFYNTLSAHIVIPGD